MKTLIHVHTDYSYDSNIRVEDLARFCEREGFDCVAVTDHDTIEGALRLHLLTSVHAIVGEEISTRDGHMIGLYLSDWIPPGMSAMDTAKAIRGQGGLVLAPHPFIRALSSGLGKVLWSLEGWVDAIEVGNGQNLSRRADRLARAFAEAHDLPQYVGADSHMNTSIAPCYQLMADARDAQSFLRALSEAKLVRGRHPWSYFVSTGWRAAFALGGLPLPRGYGANFRRAGAKDLAFGRRRSCH